MHFCLVKFNPQEGPPSHGLDDVILPMYHALKRLGFKVEIRVDSVNPDARNIVFGSCTAPRLIGRMLPSSSIIVNLEQLVPGSIWLNSNYMAHLREFTVWEYSRDNITVLKSNGVTKASLVPLGYVPEMTRLAGGTEREFDILFYGLLNERRKRILDALKTAGVNVLVAPPDTFGDSRDKLIAKARTIINIHFATPAALEVARLGYLWANGKAVISEYGPQTSVDERFSDACAFFEYDKLVEGTLELLKNDSSIKELETRGYEAFSYTSLQDTLKIEVGCRPKGMASFESAGFAEKKEPSGSIYLPGVSGPWIV